MARSWDCAHLVYAISRLRTRVTQSRDCLRNLRISRMRNTILRLREFPDCAEHIHTQWFTCCGLLREGRRLMTLIIFVKTSISSEKQKCVALDFPNVIYNTDLIGQCLLCPTLDSIWLCLMLFGMRQSLNVSKNTQRSFLRSPYTPLHATLSVNSLYYLWPSWEML